MIAQRRDANEREIVEIAARLGAACIPMDRSAGFDRLIVAPAGVFIVEIKDPAQRWRLTENEAEQRARVEAAGGGYYIIETVNEIIGLVMGYPCADILAKGNQR